MSGSSLTRRTMHAEFGSPAILAKRHLLDTCLLRMTPFKSMLLTLRSGPESLALTARQVPVYLMVVILHIPMPCLHGAASYQRRLWRIASTTTIYNSSPPGASPGHSAGSGMRCSRSSQDCHTPASWPPGHHSRLSGSADGRVERGPSARQRSA